MRFINVRLSKNILVIVWNVLFCIKMYMMSVFLKILVINIIIKMIGIICFVMMFFFVFIVDQCLKDKLKCLKKEVFWFIFVCSFDII